MIFAIIFFFCKTCTINLWNKRQLSMLTLIIFNLNIGVLEDIHASYANENHANVNRNQKPNLLCM